MALSDIIIPAGKCIVVLSSSTLSIVPNGSALNFGSVQSVNQLSDKTTVGMSILFDINKATPFIIISGTTFYLVDEADVQFNEIIS